MVTGGWQKYIFSSILKALKSTTVLGLMSGSSLDGLDLALVHFQYNNRWDHEVLATGTEGFSKTMLKWIEDANYGSALDLAKAHTNLGREFGKLARQFLDRSHHEADLICSHGHTIFHQPEIGLTFQAGSGAEIAAAAGCDTVCDLRTTDLALGGQGAPLVPVGEQHLFPDSNVFLNLGGIANISVHGDKVSAFDICHCNMILNFLSGSEGFAYDEGGRMARSGNMDPQLLNALLDRMIVDPAGPRSLGREHFKADILPILQNEAISVNDRSRTAVEAIATCIIRSLPDKNLTDVMITGGGAYNDYLIERMKALSTGSPFIPDPTLIEFKEAIIFAFLGLLRLNESTNCSADVTGSKRDNIGGAIYLGNSSPRS